MDVGHSDLQEQILWLRGAMGGGGGKVQVQAVPSRLWVNGNEGADWRAEEGRKPHPNNDVPRSKPQWVCERENLRLAHTVRATPSGSTMAYAPRPRLHQTCHPYPRRATDTRTGPFLLPHCSFGRLP